MAGCRRRSPSDVSNTGIEVHDAAGAIVPADGFSPARLTFPASDHAQQATAETRELAHGILPSVLTHALARD
jgi:hypothetical protein